MAASLAPESWYLNPSHQSGVGMQRYITMRLSSVNLPEELKRVDDDYGRSTIIETALPPPRQSVARPRFALRSFIAYTRVVSTRAPLQPIGWPSATAPPFTLN